MTDFRKLTPGPIAAATHNKGKVRELKDLLAPLGFTPQSADELNLPEPEETGSTFAANAALKALAAAKAANMPALADDSGLAVDALYGDPGIFSARWGGPERDFASAMEKVNSAMVETGSDDRSAHFVCVLCVAWPDGHSHVFEGRVDGRLVWPPRGDKGFGYDPIFIRDGDEMTFGELDPALKHTISHRADAFAKLTAALL